MTIEQLEEEISAIPRFGAQASLENLGKYLEVLGHPESNLRVLHVAGTNGKGSVCAYLEAILRTAGYRTALFTSPHLVHFNERFRINFQVCEDNKLTEAWQKIKALMEGQKYPQLKPLTYFEILFLMSLLIFSKENVDYCIMETGLGGRLDATVLTRPVLSVLTSISLDHVGILGDTIPAIAAEKAGIIKPGVPVVAINENNGAFPVFRKKAEEQQTSLYEIRSENIRFSKKSKNNIDFSMESSYYKNSHLTVRGQADYQACNGALAALAVKVLLPRIEDEVIQKGLLAMCWPGRMEEIRPGVYVDGAHNPGAVRQICHTIRRMGGKWHLLFAVCQDKAYEEMIRMLADIPWKDIRVTAIEEARGMEAAAVMRCFRKNTEAPLYQYEDVGEALLAALRHKEEDERLLCLGSLYLVGEIRRREPYSLESEDIS